MYLWQMATLTNNTFMLTACNQKVQFYINLYTDGWLGEGALHGIDLQAAPKQIQRNNPTDFFFTARKKYQDYITEHAIKIWLPPDAQGLYNTTINNHWLL